MSRRFNTHCSRIFFQGFVAMAACVSLLQLPVPMLHEHHAYESLTSLANHLDLRHHATQPVEDELHWHFVMPRELNHEEGSDEDSTTPETDIVCIVSHGVTSVDCSKSFEGHFAGSLLQDDAPAGDLNNLIDPAFTQSHPFFTYRSSVRLCALLCVARC